MTKHQDKTGQGIHQPSKRFLGTIGIWRLIDRFHQGQWTNLFYAQPADAAGSPRADYVVKSLTDDLDAQVEGKSQLKQEAECIASVTHPNMVALLDSSLTAAKPYIVLPRLEGQPLSTWLRSTYFQPLPVLLWWTRQCAQAMSALHTAGWLHGDIKPDNIIVSPRGHLSLIDFGLAQRCGAAIDKNRFQGTLAYASPELIDGTEVASPAADIFALGAVFYHMISRNKTMHQRFTPDYDALSHARVPQSMIDLVRRMTADDPSERLTSNQLTETIFRLEIETLGMHIQPDDMDDAKAA